MKKDGKLSYIQFVSSLKKSMTKETAMMHAIGDGDFDAFGLLERELLIDCGLTEHDYLIDVGCGSGRLAKPLSVYLKGKYLGTDVVSELVDFARSNVKRSDWSFKVVSDFVIPEDDDKADMVCFFSVLTHLLHEHSFLYLKEAIRVLKPGGKIIFSFLEFKIPSHLRVFEETIANPTGGVLNQFICRDGIRAWVKLLGQELIGIYDGDQPHFSISAPIDLKNGQVFEKEGNLGQSVCILKKPIV